MKKIFNYPLIILFSVFIGVFTLFDMFVPERAFSEIENRYLATKPKATVKTVFDNSFSKKYETYINDQFVLRDGWINIKSLSEISLGKIQNNAITYGKDNYMFEVLENFDEKKLARNSGFVKDFVEKYQDKNITLSIVPTSYMVLDDKLPLGILKANQLDYINSLYNTLEKSDNIQCINMAKTLSEHKNEYIYYRTDHHWTTLGAYYGYLEFAKEKGFTPVEIAELKSISVPNFMGTYFNKAKLFTAKPDTITYYDIPVEHFEFEDSNSKDSMYDYSKFETRDKYAAFMHGNNGITYIKSANNLNKTQGETSRLLIIKDSYANSFIPYLTFNYDEIFVVDLRGLPVPISELEEKYNFDDIMVMYNFVSFMNDNNFSRLLK
ncbi:MAG: DHHW family protein [Oscillospiraceae bacterium]